MPKVIKNDDVKVSGDKVMIGGEGAKILLESLVQKNTNTLMELTDRVGVVSPKEISIGKDGTIILKGKKIAANAERIIKAESGFLDTNCQCGGPGSGTLSW